MDAPREEQTIILSKSSYQEDEKRHKKPLYIVQKRPAGFPDSPLWSINSSFEKALNGPIFETLNVERKNHILRSVCANFRFRSENQGGAKGSAITFMSEKEQLEVQETNQRAGASSDARELVKNGGMKNPTDMSQSSGDMDDLTAQIREESEIQAIEFTKTSHTINTHSGALQQSGIVASAKQNDIPSSTSSGLNRNQVTSHAECFTQDGSSHSHLTRPISATAPKFVSNMFGSPPTVHKSRRSSIPPPATIALSTERPFSNTKHVKQFYSDHNISKPSSQPPSLTKALQRTDSKSHNTSVASQNGLMMSRSPSRLSVVIGGARAVVTPNSQAMSSFLRVEVPSGKPAKSMSTKVAHHDSHIQSLVPAKKRGRPFASREAELMAQRKAEIKQQKANGTYEHTTKKKTGRPPKGASKHLDIQVPEFKFAVFRCKFAGCPAQLRNAETLKKHIYVVHGNKRKRDPKSKRYPCLWEGCCELADVQDDDDLEIKPESRPYLKFKGKREFDSLQDWKGHIETVHMWYVHWTQGDGPKSQHLKISLKPKSLYESEPWLFDNDGQIVTPEVDISKTYRESPKEHYIKLFKRIRDRHDGEWVYLLKEDVETMPAKKKRRIFGIGAQSPARWEDLPDDIGDEEEDAEDAEGQVNEEFLEMSITR